MKRVFVMAVLLAATVAYAQEEECILGEVSPLLERADSVKKTGKNEITESPTRSVVTRRDGREFKRADSSLRSE